MKNFKDFELNEKESSSTLGGGTSFYDETCGNNTFTEFDHDGITCTTHDEICVDANIDLNNTK